MFGYIRKLLITLLYPEFFFEYRLNDCCITCRFDVNDFFCENQSKFSQVSWKVVWEVFCFFWLELEQHEDSKLTQKEKSCTRVFGQKLGRNEFFEFYNKLMVRTFLVLCIKLQQQRGWKSGKIVLIEFLFWGLWRMKKWTKN